MALTADPFAAVVWIGAANQMIADRRSIVVNGKPASVFGLHGPDGQSGLTLVPGERFAADVLNQTGEPTIIHWHGQTPPPDQDGVTDNRYAAAIAPGATQRYDFPARPGTHWMHSHHGLQEQALLAAPLIVRSAGGGRLLVLESASITRAPRAEIAIGPRPAHVVPDADGIHAYVTDSHEGVVMVVDLKAGRIVARIPVGAEPHRFRLSPGGAELCVANMRSNDVSFVDVRNHAEVARIRVGRVPVQVTSTPDGRQVFASLSGENRVAIIDRAARKLVGTVPVDRNPVQLQVTPDGRWLYVANQGSKAEPDETVSVIDVTTRQPAATIPSGRGAHGIAMSHDGALVFVSNIVDGSIAVLDVATQSRRTVHRVGAGPNGIAFLPSA